MNILMRKYFNIQKNGNINSDSNKVKKEQGISASGDLFGIQ